MKQFNKFFLLIIINLFVVSANAQLKLPGEVPPKWVTNLEHFVDVPTPIASSLGTYGNIGMAYYTGRPDISIPLYNLKVRGFSMPITLSYDASGVMPNSLPTWVGQNWTLNVGGVITRNRCWNFDEWVGSTHARNGSYGLTFNYFQCHGKLIELLNKPDGNYKELKDAVSYATYDLSPDEFSFNFMGKSGKFYLDANGNWVVQSVDNLEVIFDINKSSNFIHPFYPRFANKDLQPKSIAGFIIRDENGYEYQFGYSPNAIEYNTNFWRMSISEHKECWHAMSWYLSKVTDRYGNVLFSLSYERGTYIIQVFNCSYTEGVYTKSTGIFGAEACYTNSNQSLPYSFTISSPVYLKRIKALNGLTVDLLSSKVGDNMGTEKLYKKLYTHFGGVSGLYQELAKNVSGWLFSGAEHTPFPSKRGFYYLQEDDDSLYKFRHNPPSFYNKGRYLPTGSDRDIREDLLSYSRLRKLDCIAIRREGNPRLVNTIGFKFCTSIVNKRLCLDSVLVQDNAGENNKTGIKNKYKFRYNKFERLPEDYLTTAVDHWGYYNGRSYYRQLNKMETLRNPNFEFSQIGVLNKIIYPTGGCVVMEYEPNTYGQKLTHNRQELEKNDGIGGGLRIKSIKMYDSDKMKQLISERIFSYNVPGTSMSSGELFALPLYRWNYKLKCEQDNVTYYMGISHSSSIVPLVNSSGSSVGYSYVTEMIKDIDKQGENMETHVYHFSNLSTKGAKDQPFILTFGYTDVMTPSDEYTDLSFKRGLLLNETIYDQNGKKAHAIEYKYRTDESDYFKQHVLTSNLRYECPYPSAAFAHYFGGVYKLYYPKYDVVEEQDTIFPADGSSPIITIKKFSKVDKTYTSGYAYKHDVNVRLTVGQNIIRANTTEGYRYKFGMFTHCNEEDSILYKKMFYIKPLDIIFQRNGQLVSVFSTKYKKLVGKGYLVPSLFIHTNHSSKADTLVSNISYTDTGVPFYYKEQGRPSTFLRWGYNDCYLIVKSYTYVPFAVSNEDFLDSENYFSKLLQYVRTASPGTVAYTYDMLSGPTAIMRSNGSTTTYKYNQFGDLHEIYDFNGNLLKKYQYNYRR
jgi:hypothetical protein